VRWAPRLPRRTIRLRLTLLYGCIFVACGAALLAVNYVLVSHQYTSDFFLRTGKVVYAGTADGVPAGNIALAPDAPPKILFPGVVVTQTQVPSPAKLLAQAEAQSAAAKNQLLMDSAIALAIMAVASVILGWLVAGRALAPLRLITNTARDISASDLHRRLELSGPDDELQELGRTFNGLLARLEASFEAQRRFVANASHELRTPLTLERALVEVALADPDATVDTLRATCEQVLAAGKQQELLIDALLTLSRSQRGLERYEPVDLGGVAADVVETLGRGDAAVEAQLAPALTRGDPYLVERLVANLLGNAVHHNVEHGWISVSTATRGGQAILSISNSGPIVPAGDLDRLFQPFQRLDGERAAARNGVGLGLSIVDAIARAHGAAVLAHARPRGGLAIEVSFPAARLKPRALLLPRSPRDPVTRR
jgi:signal transduction histidine kinase